MNNMDFKKIEKAIEKIMANIGLPVYCSICEDWYEEDHFSHLHLR